jgi:hypothetical protein
MDRIIKVKQRYRHFKGNLYEVMAIAMHTETGEDMVIYQDVNCPEKIYARPCDMFNSLVDTIKYPDVKQKYRFEEE